MSTVTFPAWFPAWLADPVERAGMTFVEAALAFLLAAESLDATTLQLAAMAGLAAALAVAKGFVVDFLRDGRHARTLLGDVTERALATFAEVFLAIIILNPGDVGTWKIAWVSAFPAGLAVVKAAIATRIGQSGSASLLPARIDPTPVRFDSHLAA